MHIAENEVFSKKFGKNAILTAYKVGGHWDQFVYSYEKEENLKKLHKIVILAAYKVRAYRGREEKSADLVCLQENFLKTWQKSLFSWPTKWRLILFVENNKKGNFAKMVIKKPFSLPTR